MSKRIEYTGKLLPCPLCGESAVVTKDDPGMMTYFVECQNYGDCGHVSTPEFLSVEEAVNCWNNRPGEIALTQRVEMLEAYVSKLENDEE